MLAPITHVIFMEKQLNWHVPWGLNEIKQWKTINKFQTILQKFSENNRLHIYIGDYVVPCLDFYYFL